MGSISCEIYMEQNAIVWDLERIKSIQSRIYKEWNSHKVKYREYTMHTE